jgi:hypothetical protein
MLGLGADVVSWGPAIYKLPHREESELGHETGLEPASCSIRAHPAGRAACADL